eukprot:2454012-Amphidinium_carterae.1
MSPNGEVKSMKLGVRESSDSSHSDSLDSASNKTVPEVSNDPYPIAIICSPAPRWFKQCLCLAHFGDHQCSNARENR